MAGHHKTASFSPRPFQKLLSCDRQPKYDRGTPSPEIFIITSRPPVIASVKTDDRDRGDTDREQFLAGINLFSCKVQATRLLPDLQAIIRSLIFPQHIFW